jgi:activating signal cointegrator 1
MNYLTAISLHEPWASAMAFGFKRNETRNRLTHFRGDLVVCAAKRPIDAGGIALLQLHIPLPDDYPTPYGCAVAIVEVYSCLPTSVFGWTVPIPLTERALGNYAPGRWAWLTRNLRRIKNPIPVKGKQGFFRIPADLIPQSAIENPQ